MKRKSIIEVTVLSRGCLIKLENYGNSRGGGSKGKVPSVRGMDILLDLHNSPCSLPSPFQLFLCITVVPRLICIILGGKQVKMVYYGLHENGVNNRKLLHSTTSTCLSQSLGKSHEFEIAVPLRQLNKRTVILTKSCRIPIWSSG